jgi:type II secretory pathway component PulF
MNLDFRGVSLLAVAIAPGLAVAGWALVMVPQFADMFDDMSVNLPFETTLLFATFRWWGVVALLTIALRAWWPNPS